MKKSFSNGRSMTPELLHIISRLKAQDSLIAYNGSDIYRIRPTDIYYIESVDNKAFSLSKRKNI